MSAYTVKAGDTFDTISRRVYGDHQFAALIAQANPGAAEPLAAGTTLITPTAPGAPANNRASNAPASNPNETAILVDGERFRFWSDLRLTQSLDAMDTFEFEAPFDSTLPAFKQTFVPFSYKPVVITIGGVTRFTGTNIGVTPNVGNDRKTISVSGYSRPGVLNDCTPPASMYPLVEYNGQSLQQIAKTLAKPFGLDVVFNGPPGAVVERVSAGASETILSFLSGLAKQRSLVISSTPDGKVLFQQSVNTGKPVAALRQGQSPVLDIRPTFSPQEYYSHITGLESVVLGMDGSQYTVKNPHLANIIRPLVFLPPDVIGGDVREAVKAKVGRMYGNMANYHVDVDTWRDPQGALWAPNTSMTLYAPDAMIYSPYEFILRSVAFNRNGEKEVATLDLILPGAFSGEGPKVFPWEA